MLIHLPDPFYHDASTRVATWEKVLAGVRRTPFVQSASLSVLTPLDGFYRGVNLEAPGFQPRSEEDKSVGVNTVSDSYFATMATSIVRGRDFTANDLDGATPVAMLNETAARHFFPGRDPVGSMVKFRDQWWKIIGVVADAREADLRKQASRFLYVPMRQPLDQNAFMTLGVRTSGDPRQVLSDVQKRLGGVGPDIQVVRTNTLAQQRDESLLQERLISTLASAFGFLGLALCAVGLYGVLAYSVARRTSEIGIRIALGALPDQVVRSVLRQTLILVAVGLAMGIPASLFLAKLVESLFFGVTPTDVPTQVYAASALAVVAFAASYLPARRAGRIDPMVALRYE
jgi:putative ABC transport system permease protein